VSSFAMKDVILTGAFVLALAVVTALLSLREPPQMRPWLWAALAEYLGCSIAEYYVGEDANGYRRIGTELARFLDASFGWASQELLLLFLQEPSAFDPVVLAPGTNTGSMCAATGFVMYVSGSSPYAAQALISGLAMFGALSVYAAFREECPDVPPL